jgi:hypothetical protein
MPTIYIDSALSDEQRRHRVYGDDLSAFSAHESATKLAELARELSEAELSEAAFAPDDPQIAAGACVRERYVEILAVLMLAPLPEDVIAAYDRRPAPAAAG